jgi:putative flippase GtrA
MRFAINYTIFALLATIANIGSQDTSLRLYQGAYAVMASVMVGTAVGLIVKYILDKKYIFQFQIKNAAHDTQTFTLYTLTGIFTTAVFWGFEFGFDYLFQSKEMRYTGGVIGLAIGYYVKYQLDKRFVFVMREA